MKYDKEWGNKSVFSVEFFFHKRFSFGTCRKAVVVYAPTREELAGRLKEWRRALNWTRRLREQYLNEESIAYGLVEGVTPKYSLRYIAVQLDIIIVVRAGSKPKPRVYRCNRHIDAFGREK